MPIPNTPGGSPRDTTAPSSVFLTGRVVVDQGGAPPEAVIVEQFCGNTVRARTRTDLRGNFNLALGQASNMDAYINSDASEQRDSRSRPTTVQLAGCDLRAVLNGYISTELHLDGSGDIGVKNVGTIILKPLSGTAPAGNSISVTSYQVPDKARKEYDKAVKLSDNKDLKRSEEHLLKAVEIYPKYAAAWVLLGEIRKQGGNYKEAKLAFLRAQQADPSYVFPYIHLAYIAAQERSWGDVLQLSEQAIRLNPVDSADAYFLNAVAHFNLHHINESRRSGLKAAEIDKSNHIPRIHYLLATIYEAMGERPSAIAQLSQFVALEPNAPESATARQRLETLRQEAEKSASN